MKPGSQSLVCLACSIFRAEIGRLQETQRLTIPVRFLSSMLHLNPDRLERGLDEQIAQEKVKGARVVLAFGDCCPHMTELEAPHQVVRTAGINCCEILLGSKEYRRLRKEGAFFIMPEWAVRWREVFREGLGLSATNAQEFMTEMHTHLIYLDTGLMPVPQAELAGIVEYTGLPLQIQPVSLEPLLASLLDCQGRMEEP